MDSRNRFQQIRRILIYILILNWGVAAAKLIYGWLISSASMKADGFHSFSDGSSTLNAFLVMIVTMAVNIFVMVYENKKGKELKSDVLVSDALHTRADILTSASVIITLMAIRLGYPMVDPIASLAIALFIGYAAVQILSEILIF